MNEPLKGSNADDVISFEDYKKSDSVNSPAHYTRGSQEAIDIIEEAIQDAPSVETGMLQAQVLKYLLRLWLKENPEQDAKKARWYLNRLISKLESYSKVPTATERSHQHLQNNKRLSFCTRVSNSFRCIFNTS